MYIDTMNAANLGGYMKAIFANLNNNIALDKIANIAIISVALLMGFVIIKNYLFEKANNTQTLSAVVGRKVSLSEVGFEKSSLSVVLLLSTQCRYCAQSMPFYKALSDMRRKPESSFQLFTVFPQDRLTVESHLKDFGLSTDAIETGPKFFQEMGVLTTPTLLLVNSKGVIEKAWAGELTVNSQNEVISDIKKIAPRRSV
jgi:hypothetical protein